MNKNQSGPSVPAVLGAAVLTGFALTLALMVACALAVLMGGLPADKIALWADLCLVLGSLCAAFLAAKRSSVWQPLWGLAAGVIVFVCLAILSFAWFGEQVQLSRLLINAILTIASAAVGGVLGARRRRQHKKRRK